MNVFKQSINRVKQSVDEKFGSAERTELDPDLQRLINRAEEIKSSTEKILSDIEAYIQPDPSLRILPNMMMEGLNKPETVGQNMSQLGTKLGTEDSYGKIMIKGGEAFHKMGQVEREFMAAAQTKYVLPVRRFLNEEVKILEQEKKELNNKRLDMDALKPKVAKGGAPAELEFKAAQEAFNKSVESVRSRLLSVEGKLAEMQKAFKEFIETEIELHAKKTQILNDYKKNL